MDRGAGRLGRALLLAALLTALSALVRQSGWLFWREGKNALVLALTVTPFLLAFLSLLGVERAGHSSGVVAGTWCALGLLIVTGLLYLPSGLGGPAFVVYPLSILILGAPVFAVPWWRAWRRGR